MPLAPIVVSLATPIPPIYKSIVFLLVYYSIIIQYYSYILTYSYNVYSVLSILALMLYGVRRSLTVVQRCSLQ
jgi:hypothetical protein